MLMSTEMIRQNNWFRVTVLGSASLIRSVGIKRDAYADGACQVAFMCTFSWVAGDVPFSFRFNVACQAFPQVIDRHDDSQSPARFRQLTDIGFAVRSAG